MVPGAPQLLDNNPAYGNRELLHPLPIRSGGAPCRLAFGRPCKRAQCISRRLFATLGALIGAIVNYYLALWLGRPIVYKFANSRFGHMCLIDEPAVKKAEEYFEKRGAASTFIGRLIPAVRQLISIPAGLARMKIGTFLLFTALGAGIWNGVLAGLGWYLSKVPGIETKEQLIEKVTVYSHEIGYCFLALGVFIVAYLVYKGWKK